jgi:hypothetical protein
MAQQPFCSAMNTIDFSGFTALPDLGVIRAQGADAANFLHGQLTQDVALQTTAQARLAGYCSAKGRLLASFVVIKRDADDLLLVCPRDLLAPTLKRLSMFVLRAKAKLTDASAEWQVGGLAGPAVPPALPDAPWAHVREADASLVRLPAGAGVPRALWLAPQGQPQPGAAVLPLAHWQWLDVASGVATVSAPVVDAFVPQMLNYESVGGVNFKKGCYPGQEVVARSQFRGTLKRRAYVVHADGELQPGQEVFHESDAEQPCGTVVQAAPAPNGGFDAIVSMQVSAAQGGALRSGGHTLALLPLPYELLEDI